MRRRTGDPSPGAEPTATAGLLGITARTTTYQIVSNSTAAAAAVVTARHLGATGRGVLVLFLAVGSLALLVCSLGVNTSGRLLLVDSERPVALGDFLGLCAALSTVQSVVCAVLGAVLLPLAHVHVDITDVLLLGLLGVGLFGQYLVAEAVNAYGRISTAAAIQAVGGVAQLGAVLALAAVEVHTPEPFLVVIAAGSLLQVALFLVVLGRLGLGLRPGCDRQSWWRLVHDGLPGVAVNLGTVLTFRIDRYLVGLFLGPAAVGVYSVAATVPELLRLPTIALGEPIFYRLASGSARLNDFRRSRTICLLSVAGLAAVVAALAPFAVRIVFGPEYSSAVTPLRILLLGEVGIAVYYLDGSSLFGLGRLSDVAIAAIAGLVIVTAADLVLVPAWGIAGAAWASVPAYWAMGLVTYRYLRKRAGDGTVPAPVPGGELHVEPLRRLDA